MLHASLSTIPGLDVTQNASECLDGEALYVRIQAGRATHDSQSPRLHLFHDQLTGSFTVYDPHQAHQPTTDTNQSPNILKKLIGTRAIVFHGLDK
jgi:hypothetical protein